MRGKKELRPVDMTDDQRQCYELLCDLVRGEHHLIGKVTECGRGIHFGMRCRSLATYDFDDLTRLVVMAHDRMIRVEIVPTGFGTIGIDLHKRHTRDGEMFKRHPTIEDSIARVRGVSSNAM